MIDGISPPRESLPPGATGSGTGIAASERNRPTELSREGDIVEQGNHEELLSREGFYAELYNSQFEAMTIG